MSMKNSNWNYRQKIQTEDVDAIVRIVRSSGFFSPGEVKLACELAVEKLNNGEESSYQFLFIEDNNTVCGYTCFGLIPATIGSYDLYWIAIVDKMRGKGVGNMLLARTEEIILGQGGRQIYAETSSRAQYEPTRCFYEKYGYTREAVLKNFYAPGDSKIIYSKVLESQF